MEPDIISKLNELARLIIELKYAEALELFYDPEVVTHENENPPTIGLENYKNMAKTFVGGMKEYKAELLDQLVSGDISVSRWHYRFEHDQWGHWDRTQFSVQRWKNGKIVHERHHYSQ